MNNTETLDLVVVGNNQESEVDLETYLKKDLVNDFESFASFALGVLGALFAYSIIA